MLAPQVPHCRLVAASVPLIPEQWLVDLSSLSRPTPDRMTKSVAMAHSLVDEAISTGANPIGSQRFVPNRIGT